MNGFTIYSIDLGNKKIHTIHSYFLSFHSWIFYFLFYRQHNPFHSFLNLCFHDSPVGNCVANRRNRPHSPTTIHFCSSYFCSLCHLPTQPLFDCCLSSPLIMPPLPPPPPPPRVAAAATAAEQLPPTLRCRGDCAPRCNLCLQPLRCPAATTPPAAAALPQPPLRCHCHHYLRCSRSRRCADNTPLRYRSRRYATTAAATLCRCHCHVGCRHRRAPLRCCSHSHRCKCRYRRRRCAALQCSRGYAAAAASVTFSRCCI